jgi:hypothetical protein
MVSGWWTDIKDTLPADTINIFCSSVVIRDSDGDVVHAVRGCVEHMLNALHDEVIVCLHGVQEVIKQGIGATTIEIDALQVLQEWSSCSFDLSSTGHLISKLRELAEANFAYFRLIYMGIMHACNIVSHALTTSGSECVSRDNLILDTVLDYSLLSC